MKIKMVLHFTSNRLYDLLHWVANWACILFVPGVVVPCVAVLFEGSILVPENVCVLRLYEMWFPILFFVANTGLCGVMVYLFVAPLYDHAKAIKEGKLMYSWRRRKEKS